MKTKEQYDREIWRYLRDYTFVTRENPEYYRENAVIVETFARELLNLCYGYHLESANTTNINFPAVDLVDPNSKTAVRVVGSFATMRAKAIVGRFCENHLKDKYENLIIFAPLSIGRYRSEVLAKECEGSGIHLSVLSMRDIISQIEVITDHSVLNNIIDLVKKEVNSVRQDAKTPKLEDSHQKQNILPNSEDAPFIFISYSHADNDRVQSIVEAMARKGMSVWWDQDIEPGTPWDETIGQHLFDCKCVVALVTKNFMDSSACMDEIYVGKEKDKLLMVYLEDLELPPKMYRYMRIQDIRFTAKTEADAICERLSKTELLKDCYSSN